MELQVQKIPKNKAYNGRKAKSSSEVFLLEEVQKIKDAVQEHLLFVGLDNRNNIRNISLIAVGSNNQMCVSMKYIVRTALVSDSSKVVLVHNHPSNSLKPSYYDKDFTNAICKVFEVFNIELLDHIIVNENEYLSMGANDFIDRDYKDSKIDFMKKAFLIEENNKLKQEIENLNNKKEIKQELFEEKEEDEL